MIEPSLIPDTVGSSHSRRMSLPFQTETVDFQTETVDHQTETVDFQTETVMIHILAGYSRKLVSEHGMESNLASMYKFVEYIGLLIAIQNTTTHSLSLSFIHTVDNCQPW